MAIILDTNALSAFADGQASLRDALESEIDLALPVIVLGEYLYGVRQSRHRARYEDWLKAHLPAFVILEIEKETASRYAELRSELKAVGRPIPSNDVWIAALARQHGCRVVTRDRHFEAVRGLRLLYW
ncbi:MAG TPA: type II toxin-antitoxin system VapC family toxin [Bryobacteraceae bacterium]|jgi:predicted nucleic acid-binding protein